MRCAPWRSEESDEKLVRPVYDSMWISSSPHRYRNELEHGVSTRREVRTKIEA